MKKQLDSKFRNRIIFGVALSLTLFIGVQFFSNTSINGLLRSEEEMNTSYELAKKLEIIEMSIDFYQDNIRNFIVSGNNDFLKNNERNLSKATSALTEILSVKNHPNQKKLLLEIDSIINDQVNFNEGLLIIYDRLNPETAIKLIDSGVGEKYVGKIVDRCNAIRKLEETYFSHIKEENDSFPHEKKNLDYLASFLAIIGIVLSVFLLLKDIKRRGELEQEVRLAQKEAMKS